MRSFVFSLFSLKHLKMFLKCKNFQGFVFKANHIHLQHVGLCTFNVKVLLNDAFKIVPAYRISVRCSTWKREVENAKLYIYLLHPTSLHSADVWPRDSCCSKTNMSIRGGPKRMQHLRSIISRKRGTE